MTPGPARSRYVRSDRVLSRRTADGVVVLPVDHGELFDLTGSGLAVWDVLASPHTVAEAVAELLERYEGVTDQVAADLEPVLEELLRRRAVVVVAEGPTQ